MTTKDTTLRDRPNPGADADVRDSSAAPARRASARGIYFTLAGLILLGVVLGFGFVQVSQRDQTSGVSASVGSVSEQTQSAASTAVLSGTGDKTIAEDPEPSGASPAQEPGEVAPAPGATVAGISEHRRIKSPDTTVRDDGQAEALSISGQVVDEEGQPLRGIEVLATAIRVFGANEEPADPTRREARSTVTGHDGSFEFWDLADGEYRIHTGTLDGFAPAQTTVRAGTTSAKLVLAWQRDFQVFGIVTGSAGRPLEGVQVTSAGPPQSVTHTGPQGDYEFSISVKERDRAHALHFRREGYRDQAVQLDPADLDGIFDDVLLDVSMEPLQGLATVSGHLKDTNGDPIAGEMLQLRSPALRTHYQGQSDRNGRFSMEGVEPSQDYRLSVHPKADFKKYVRHGLAIAGGGLSLEVVLEPLALGSLSGWMLDVAGNPVPRFSLSVKSKSASYWQQQVTADDDGFFTVEDIPEGSVVFRSESLPRFVINVLRSSRNDQEPVPLILDLGEQELRGWVRDGRGNAVPGSQVTLAWWHNERNVRSFSSRKTVSDANGHFAFTGLGSAVHTLGVTATEFARAEIEIDVGVEDEIVVRLDEQ